MKKISLVCLVALINCFASSALGKWAKPEEADVKTEFSNSVVHIKKNGTSEETTESQEKLLKERGRQYASSYMLYYNGDSEELKVLEAKTIKDGKEYPVDVKSIEDQPLASSPEGFDQQRQILITFPHAEIGSSIYLKYHKKIKKTGLENYYGSIFFFGNEKIAENTKIKIISELPLKFEKNDPTEAIKLSESFKEENKKKLQVIEIELVKPIYSQIVNEVATAVRLQKFHYVAFSSMDKWENFAREFSKGYEKVINSHLPKILEEIKEQAEKEKSDIDRINMVTSLLNQKLHYMGDWRAVEGTFRPRSLDKFVASQTGDCKEFSAATAAILKKMGYKASAALVNRGVSALSWDVNLPGYHFNHAIVKVTNDKGKVYWIDPTNMLSMAGGIFNDISGKRTLVLDEKNPSYETTNRIDPNHSEFLRNETIEIEGADILASGNIVFNGEMALMLTGSELFTSVDNLQDQIFRALSGTFLSADEKLELKLPELKSRIVSDVSVSYKYKQKNKLFTTNLGKGYEFVLSSDLMNIINTSDDQISEILIDSGGEQTTSKVLFFKDIILKSADKLNAEIETKWLNIKRHLDQTKEGCKVTTTIVIKDNIIPSSELKSEEYKKLKDFIEKNFKDASVIIEG